MNLPVLKLMSRGRGDYDLQILIVPRYVLHFEDLRGRTILCSLIQSNHDYLERFAYTDSYQEKQSCCYIALQVHIMPSCRKNFSINLSPLLHFTTIATQA
jgi:hypothetical protein